jgi:hypothetical protein
MTYRKMSHTEAEYVPSLIDQLWIFGVGVIVIFVVILSIAL